MASPKETFERHIREIPDFPRKGVSFKDVTPLIENVPAFHAAVESRVFGTALAYRAKKALFAVDLLAPYLVTSLPAYDQ